MEEGEKTGLKKYRIGAKQFFIVRDYALQNGAEFTAPTETACFFPLLIKRHTAPFKPMYIVEHLSKYYPALTGYTVDKAEYKDEVGFMQKLMRFFWSGKCFFRRFKSFEMTTRACLSVELLK